MGEDDTRDQPEEPVSAKGSNGRPQTQPAIPEGGVLGALPRTRPQRASPRRAAAQAKSGSDQAKSGSKPGADRSSTAKSRSGTAKPGSKPGAGRSSTAQSGSGAAKPDQTSRASTKPAAGRRTVTRGTAPRKPTSGSAASEQAPPRRAQPQAPRQGYEPEEELELGATVHPPSGVELVGSVADIFLELASAGLKAGGQALKDVLSPLRRS